MSRYSDTCLLMFPVKAGMESRKDDLMKSLSSVREKIAEGVTPLDDEDFLDLLDEHHGLMVELKECVEVPADFEWIPKYGKESMSNA